MYTSIENHRWNKMSEMHEIDVDIWLQQLWVISKTLQRKLDAA